MRHLAPELLAAILAEPDEDAPRLAAADWLEENGHADDALFVREGVRYGRRKQLRLGSAEVARLDQSLTAGVSRRAIRLPGPLGADGGTLAVEYDRGFPDGLQVHESSDAVAEICAAELPTLTRLEEFAPGRSTPACIAHLARLTSLRTLRYGIDADTLTWEQVAPLVALTRCRILEIRSARTAQTLLPAALKKRLSDARVDADRPMGDAERLSVARSLFTKAQLVEFAGGDLGLNCPRADRKFAFAAKLPTLRLVVTSGDKPSPAIREMAGLRGLHLHALGRFDPASVPLPDDLRELTITGVYNRTLDLSGLAERLAAMPRLRSLWLGGQLTGFPAALEALSGGASLRLLTVTRGTGVTPEEIARLRLPNLVELSVPAEVLRAAPGGLPGLPALRELEVNNQWINFEREPYPAYTDAGVRLSSRTTGQEHWYAPRLPGEAGRDDAVGDITVRVPKWFARREPPPADPRTPWVTPLAMWREWGEDDGSDDATLHAPGRIYLERVDGKLKVGDRRPALLDPPATVVVSKWDGVKEAAPAGGSPHFWVSGRSEALGTTTWHSDRALWVGKSCALRMRVETNSARLTGHASWLRVVFSTLRWGG